MYPPIPTQFLKYWYHYHHLNGSSLFRRSRFHKRCYENENDTNPILGAQDFGHSVRYLYQHLRLGRVYGRLRILGDGRGSGYAPRSHCDHSYCAAYRLARIGGVLFLVLGALYIVMFWDRGHWSAYLLISGPLFLIGTLFLVSWHYRRDAHA